MHFINLIDCVFIGFTSDEIVYFRESKSTIVEACREMLRNWLADEDVDSCLEDLAYTMEGLKMIAATDCIKRILEPAMEDISE